MTRPFELYPPFAPSKSCSVVAIQCPKHGFIISRTQLLSAKRRMQIPLWSVVHLRSNDYASSITAILARTGVCEVITCAN